MFNARQLAQVSTTAGGNQIIIVQRALLGMDTAATSADLDDAALVPMHALAAEEIVQRNAQVVATPLARWQQIRLGK